MSFSADMGRFIEKVRHRGDALFINTVSAVESSIKMGSPITGAPGQPVQTGALLNSWQTTFNGATAEISTNLEYAEPIETNERGMTIRSEVGGNHSVALTRAGWPSIVEDEARKLGAPE